MYLTDSLAVGALASDCKVPCTVTTATVTEASKSSFESNFSSLVLAFLSEVDTTTTTVDQFNFLESLNLLGSNLGLWLGLGLFQLLEAGLAILAARKINETLRFLLDK